MSKKLKLEVGKRYEMEDGGVVFILRRDSRGYFHGVSPSSEVRYWRPDGTPTQYPDVIRCLDDEPELVDLTKIDVPFGELDERTQDRLAGAVMRGAQLEVKERFCKGFMDWDDTDICAIPSDWTIRLAPEDPTYTMPTVDDKVWLAMPNAKAFTWNSGSLHPRVHEFINVSYAQTHKVWCGGVALPARVFGDLIQRGDCPWDQAIVLRPEGL